MNSPNCNVFSKVTKEYLTTFRCILNTMIQDMTNVNLSDSISYNFIIQMLPHHRAAIEMSYNILKYTTSIPLENIASQIILEQTESIENMQRIKCTCKMKKNCAQDLHDYQQKVDHIMQTMFTGMKNACNTNQVDADFIREMIPHHEGAVKMSENALQYDICPQLKPILEAIITSQKRGIMQMEALLQTIC